MIEKELIKEIVEKSIAETDMFIVEISVKAENVIAIVLDSDDFVNIDNCADVNKAVCNALNAAGEDDFEISVYSAGLSEPLKLKRQFIKHAGKEVDVILKSGKKQRAKLIELNDEGLLVEYEVREKDAVSKKTKKTMKREIIDTDAIKSTKLVINI